MRNGRRIALLLTFLLAFAGHAHAATTAIPINDPASAAAQAVRVDPPAPPTTPAPEPVWPTGIWNQPYAPFGLSDCDEMMFYARQFGLPEAFAGIGWRESNCRNEDGVRTSCCHGYWQLHQMHFPIPHCDAWSYLDVNSDTAWEKQKQACSAKHLYDQAGLSPWSATR